MPQGEVTIELEPGAGLADVLAALEAAPPLARVRLRAPIGLTALRSATDASAVYEVLTRRRLDLTVVTADHALILEARILGFAVEDLVRQDEGAPGSPTDGGSRRGFGGLGRLFGRGRGTAPLPPEPSAPPAPPPPPTPSLATPGAPDSVVA